jgi:hypothetical protein
MAVKTFFCIDAHTCGNPVRLVAGGGPHLEGANMSEKRQHFLREYDWIRHALMFEPRGHDMMSGSILYPPQDPANDVAVLFIETSGCLPMCGHGTIGTVTIALEQGLVSPKIPGHLRLETPAGLVQVRYGQEGKKVKWVRLTNVPAFLAAENIEVECPDLGTLRVDVAYGGTFTRLWTRSLISRIGAFSRRTTHRLGAGNAPLDQRTTYLCPPGKPDHCRLKPYPLDGKNLRPRFHGPQRCFLWRQSHRPVALWYRHQCPDGPMVCQGPT